MANRVVWCCLVSNIRPNPSHPIPLYLNNSVWSWRLASLCESSYLVERPAPASHWGWSPSPCPASCPGAGRSSCRYHWLTRCWWSVWSRPPPAIRVASVTHWDTLGPITTRSASGFHANDKMIIIMILTFQLISFISILYFCWIIYSFLPRLRLRNKKPWDLPLGQKFLCLYRSLSSCHCDTWRAVINITASSDLNLLTRIYSRV